MRYGFSLVSIACCLMVACGDDDSSSDGGISGTDGAGSGGSSGRAGASGAGTGGEGGEGDVDASLDLGPTANVRVMHLVEGVTFAAWGSGPEARPVLLADDLEHATISDYIEMPLNRITQHPMFVLWPSGEMPEEGALFSTLLENDHDHLRVEVRELDGDDQYATILVAPVDAEPDSILEYQTLDEEDTDQGDPTQANLHITTYWEPLLDTTAVPGIALLGEPCLFTGSSSVSVAWPAPPGEITLGYYDIQDTSACEDSDPIKTFELEVEAGDNELVVFYLDGGELEMLHAPMHMP